MLSPRPASRTRLRALTAAALLAAALAAVGLRPSHGRAAAPPPLPPAGVPALIAAALTAEMHSERDTAFDLFDRAFQDLALDGAALSLDTTDGFRGVSALAWSPDGQRLAVAHGDGVSLVDTRLWRAVARLDAPGDPPMSVNDGAPGRLSAPSAPSPVDEVAFSPDGGLIAAAIADGTVRLHDAFTLQIVGTCESPGGAVAGSLRFSEDGATLAAMLDNKAIRVWDVASGRILSTSPVFVMDTALAALSPDGRTVLAEVPPGAAQRWDVAQNRPLWTRPAHTSRIDAVALSPDGKVGVSGAWDESIVLWDVERGAPLRTLRGHTGSVHALAVSPDGKTLASAAWDDTLRLWDVDTGAALARMPSCAARRGVLAWSPDGTRLAAAGHGSLCVWDVMSRTWVETPRPRVPPAQIADLRPAAATVAQLEIAGSSGLLLVLDDRTIDWIDPDRRRITAVPTKWPGRAARPAALCPDAETLAVAAARGTVEIWSLESMQRTATLEIGVEIDAIAWSKRCDLLAAAAEDGPIRVWAPRSGQLVATLDAGEERTKLLAFLPGDDVLVSRSQDAAVRLWDVAAGRAIRTYAPDSPVPGLIAVAPDGAGLGVRALRRTELTRWNLRSGAISGVMETDAWRIGPFAFSPDGSMLAVGIQEPLQPDIALFDTRTGAVRASLSRRPFANFVYAARFAAEGRVLTAAYGDGDTVLFRTSDGAVTGTIRVLRGGAAALVFDDREIELFGPDAARHVACRAGPWLFPFEHCAARFEAPGLLGRLLARDPT